MILETSFILDLWDDKPEAVRKAREMPEEGRFTCPRPYCGSTDGLEPDCEGPPLAASLLQEGFQLGPDARRDQEASAAQLPSADAFEEALLAAPIPLPLVLPLGIVSVEIP